MLPGEQESSPGTEFRAQELHPQVGEEQLPLSLSSCSAAGESRDSPVQTPLQGMHVSAGTEGNPHWNERVGDGDNEIGIKKSRFEIQRGTGSLGEAAEPNLGLCPGPWDAERGWGFVLTFTQDGVGWAVPPCPLCHREGRASAKAQRSSIPQWG